MDGPKEGMNNTNKKEYRNISSNKITNKDLLYWIQVIATGYKEASFLLNIDEDIVKHYAQKDATIPDLISKKCLRMLRNREKTLEMISRSEETDF